MRRLGATRRHPTDRHLYRLGETNLYEADLDALIADKAGGPDQHRRRSNPGAA